GTIDALDHSLGVFNDFSLYEMAPYVTITNHCSSPYPLVCSTEWLESLPEDLKPIILDGIHQMCEMQRAEERANEMEYLASFEAAGATIYELTAEESAAFKELCKPAYDLWAEKVGQDLIDAWLATCPE
ncbi:MAG TPA: TRAP transporter substrate-binding protein DctP, partial [Anaerovoracaceae bacterium]|nr:TRAP transporter substrate-binding protein DctP [Anaerovoracaceae bacterium]